MVCDTGIMEDLVPWLRAQLDEDERVAREALPGSSDMERYLAGLPRYEPRDSHIARHDPARVLREVEAKRAIIDQYVRDSDSDHWEARLAADDFGEDAVRLLAAVYADRPGHREEWKP